MINRIVFLLLFIAVSFSAVTSQADDGLKSSPVQRSVLVDQALKQRVVTEYTLPADISEKAAKLGKFHFQFAIFSFFYQLLLIWAVLHFRLAVKFRDWAENSALDAPCRRLFSLPRFFSLWGFWCYL